MITRAILKVVGKVLFCICLVAALIDMYIGNIWHIQDIVSNAYFTNVTSGIITVLLLYWFQLTYCKRKIVKDLRVSEVLADLSYSIELTQKVFSSFIKETTDVIGFFDENESTFKAIHDGFMYSNNNILFDSIHTVFFLNINFKLLAIVNHIKNRLPTMDESWNAIKLAEDAETRKRNIDNYLLHVKFLAEYCDELLKYFKFDMAFVNALGKHLGMDILDYLKLSSEEQYKIYRKAVKLARKDIRRNKKKATTK